MLHKRSELVQLSWPLASVVGVTGVTYCILLVVFQDAIDAFQTLGDYASAYDWGGIETLFALTGGVAGWISVVIAQRRLDAGRAAFFIIGLLCCLASLGVGFGLAVLFLGHLSDSVWEMLIHAVVSGAGACAFRGYVSDVI